MPFQAFILAAGFGTRLRPLTDQLPKPLVPICGVPMLDYTLALCAQHQLTRVVANAHWKAEQLKALEGMRRGVRLSIVEEPEILGTGGGLRSIRSHLEDQFVVLNADVLCDMDLTQLLQNLPIDSARLILRTSPEAERYGRVTADNNGIIVQLASVATRPGIAAAEHTHFTGIHALNRSVLERVPDGFACIVRTAYRELLPLQRLYAQMHLGIWIDIGDLAAYLDANLQVLTGQLQLPLNPFAEAAIYRNLASSQGITTAHINGPVWIGHHAQVDGTRLAWTVVGHRARVSQNTQLTRCIVWDEVEVPAGEYENTVFTPVGAVSIPTA